MLAGEANQSLAFYLAACLPEPGDALFVLNEACRVEGCAVTVTLHPLSPIALSATGQGVLERLPAFALPCLCMSLSRHFGVPFRPSGEEQTSDVRTVNAAIRWTKFGLSTGVLF